MQTNSYIRISRYNYFIRCCIVFPILLAVSAVAQETDSVIKNHSVELQFGINEVKDENLHPKVSTGTITDLSGRTVDVVERELREIASRGIVEEELKALSSQLGTDKNEGEEKA